MRHREALRVGERLVKEGEGGMRIIPRSRVVVLLWMGRLVSCDVPEAVFGGTRGVSNLSVVGAEVLEEPPAKLKPPGGA